MASCGNVYEGNYKLYIIYVNVVARCIDNKRNCFFSVFSFIISEVVKLFITTKGGIRNCLLFVGYVTNNYGL